MQYMGAQSSPESKMQVGKMESVENFRSVPMMEKNEVGRYLEVGHGKVDKGDVGRKRQVGRIKLVPGGGGTACKNCMFSTNPMPAQHRPKVCVGLAVGFVVGVVLGPMEGKAVGDCVGTGVGLIVGSGVGAFVGTGVGNSVVGAAVGPKKSNIEPQFTDGFLRAS
jgi:hypothetical protein